MLDEEYIRLAVRLAKRGQGRTSPNPMVGAVIVRDDRIIGKGYHRRFGGKHAEINAIDDAGGDVKGATIYVTLEPCCHYGKTPPCVDSIIRHEIGRVVIGTLDPNPVITGKSVRMLEERNIPVTVGVLEEACRALNEAHFKYMATGMPLVTVKFAQSVDGRIATVSGSSRWISSEKSRRFAHGLRAINDAVIVGVGTVLADDPQLTARLTKGRSPLRVVLDSTLRTPLTAKVLSGQEKAATIIAISASASHEKIAALRERGIEVLTVPGDAEGGINLVGLLRKLGERGVSSVLVEGGAAVITSLLRQNLADRLVIIIAPKLLGKGIEAIGDLKIEEVSQSLKLSFTRIRRLGEDLVIEARVKP